MSPYILPGMKYKVKVPRMPYQSEYILKLVTDHYGITDEQIRKVHVKGGARRVTMPRMVYMYLMRTLTDASLNEIARVFGQHHSTVISAVRTVQDMIDTDPEVKESIEHLKNKIY